MKARKLKSILRRLKDISILVVGDLMIDEYLWGKTERISPEAPVQVVEISNHNRTPGGSGNVVTNLIPYCQKVYVAGVIGKDQSGQWLCEDLAKKGADVETIINSPKHYTSLKSRVLAASQQIIRIDHEHKRSLEQDLEDELFNKISALLPKVKAVLISDYNKGLFGGNLSQRVIEAAKKANIPVVADPKGMDYKRYRGATAITPNMSELAQALGAEKIDQDNIVESGWVLAKNLDLEALLVTRSEEGLSLFNTKSSKHKHIPTHARDVYDVTGAGDTVLALFGACLAIGEDFSTAARLANMAAGIVVAKVGAAHVKPAELANLVEREWSDSASRKITTLEDFVSLIPQIRMENKRIVFTNGCFDLLHVGHIKYLQAARNQGDLLIVGLNSDVSIQRLKGENRPLISENDRAHILSALDCVDFVIIFGTDTPIELIEAIKPDMLAKGADYSRETVVGYEFVESYGGQVVLVDLIEGHSTSNLIDKIVDIHT